MKYIITEQQLKIILNEMPYPQSFNMDTFISLTSYQKRIQYCKQHLQRIAEGSSRIAYKIDDTKVLKLAKNKKGLIQNEGEADLGYNNRYYTCIAEVFEFDEKNYTFVEMELARKCSPEDFKRIVGFDLETIINLIKHEIHGDYRYRHIGPKPEFTPDELDKFYENEFITNIVDLVHSTEVLLGDLGKPDSYGVVIRDGQEEVVVIDYGLTEDNFKKHYYKNKGGY
jgi:hypothetical protein